MEQNIVIGETKFSAYETTLKIKRFQFGKKLNWEKQQNVCSPYHQVRIPIPQKLNQE